MKNNSFIDKIRALTARYKSLPFEQKRPILAFRIESAAKNGKNYHDVILDKEERMDLEKEGFKVNKKPNELWSRISW